ncbi:STAS domain-containing protein [Streptomyces sp. NPDC048512]|uniref:STAS domain-containing protein n=1 Tax=unclassified Streptomyces TaxID=2593676 RepID=UPI0009BFCEB1|nr:STAS domain-containing protein [Streptomyces sp. M41(2017)]OQQ13806.1 hypothetical protein B0675_26600 [Streptomyces sp. M41(2017)]
MKEQPQRAERLTVSSRLIGQVTVLALAGEIDDDSAGRFEEALTAGQGPSPQRIVVDFSRVTFMDSAGINVLISAFRAMQGTDGWIRITAPEGAMRVIQIVALDTIIACYPTVEQALQA